MTLRKSALGYARKRRFIHPLYGIGEDGFCTCRKGEDCPSPGKHPRTKNGVKDASIDRDQITAWWRQWRDANIGWRMGQNGHGSKVLVTVDIDLPAGPDSVETLYDEGKLFPPTLTQHTGSGGAHYVYEVPGNQPVPNVVGLREGIDIKGDDAYIVVAPSVLSDKFPTLTLTD